MYRNSADLFASVKILDMVARRGNGDLSQRAMLYEIDTDESASIAVVRAVAEYTETQPSELEPLYERVDPDALDALIDGAAAGARVQFEYAGTSVTVEPGQVSLEEAAGSGR
ncbi:hypothetical protein GCM10028856_18960 [Halopiger thermotolerans]